MVMTDQEKKDYRKVYRLKNNVRIKQYQAQYRANNVDYFNNYHRSEKGRRCYTISNWRIRGLTPPIGHTLRSLYDEIYLPCTNCNVCKKEFAGRSDRCADHDHDLVENNFRQILCQRCNKFDVWRHYKPPNT
mgnify:FL=1